MQVGDRVRVKKGYANAGKLAVFCGMEDELWTHPLAAIRFHGQTGTHLYGVDALEPFPKDLAIGTRVKVVGGDGRRGKT